MVFFVVVVVCLLFHTRVIFGNFIMEISHVCLALGFRRPFEAIKAAVAISVFQQLLGYLSNTKP